VPKFLIIKMLYDFFMIEVLSPAKNKFGEKVVFSTTDNCAPFTLCHLKKVTNSSKKNTKEIQDLFSMVTLQTVLVLSPGLGKFSDKQWWTQLSVCVGSITGLGVL
jgi:hypothetical protein